MQGYFKKTTTTNSPALVELIINGTIDRAPIGPGLYKYIIYQILILAIQQSYEIGNMILIFLKDLFLASEQGGGARGAGGEQQRVGRG